MADKQPEEFKPIEERPTWKDKLNSGTPLNALDETKADADFNYKRRLREEEEKQAFEKLKAGGVPAADTSDSTDTSDDNTSSNDGKKGKN